ncbi:hypothetical protein OFN33_22670 [Escherichia coli]|nr:hypothetical protein [Escherichia coli]
MLPHHLSHYLQQVIQLRFQREGELPPEQFDQQVLVPVLPLSQRQQE